MSTEMPHLFARQSHQRHSTAAHSSQAGVDSGRLEALASALERKIHPDINLLAEELSASIEPKEAEAKVYQGYSESSALEQAGFVGLGPSARSQRPTKGIRTKDNKLDEADGEQIQKATFVQGISDYSPSPSLTTQPNPEHIELRSLSSIMRWSTFGKHSRTHSNQRKQGPDTEIHADSKSASQSSLEQSQSLGTSRHSSPYIHANQLPRTPGSETDSQHHSTPSYVVESLGMMSSLPSPHIFGPQTPSRSDAKQDESYFDFKEIPPPLPPLDHPAFRKGPPTSFKFPLAKYNFPVLPDGQDSDTDYGINDSNRQITHSLPSLKGSKGKSTQGPKERRRSMRSHPQSNAGVDSPSEKKSYIHSRQQSKSSIATSTSRRSSAEYSAKQASSIGEDLYKMHDGCWEVEVSRAMVSLALGKEGQRVETRTGSAKTARLPNQGAIPSSFGKARGKNRASGGELRLGSPFLLQDTRTDNLTGSQSSKDYSARIISNLSRKSRAVTETLVQNQVMSNGGSILQPTSSPATYATRKGKERASGGPLSAGSRSGGVGRAISSPSLTPTTLESPAKLDTSSVFVSMEGSSTLQPPQVSITKATPEASPISPTTRRGHHKSTPTMPTASVLKTKTASAPGVIEKSYSSGSGKRKADEAGVSGDKTPPKETKEARTTFAPEPRTHRASASSSAHAPSSFNRSKRVRLTDASDGRGSYRSSASRAGSVPTPNDSPPNAKNTGSWSSKGSHGIASQSSHHYGPPPPGTSASHASHYSSSQQRAPSRRSLSQASIPISALISPHAPSISRLSTFHMRDPRKPNPIQSTPWSLSFPSAGQADESRWSWRGWVERGGSPLHAWVFFIGFILFPLWWAAALFIPIPKTRRLEDTEKGVILDDPQVEHDAKSWRTRCRVMAGVSLLTYVPFIVLVVIFA